MICILTPYGRNETTAAALRLADLVVGAGGEVRLVACGVHETGVHPFWDQYVRTGRQEHAYHAAIGCDAYVHFVCDKKLLEITTLVNSKAPQLLVPNWTTLTPRQDDLVKEYTAVVCPTRACYRALKHDLYGGRKVSSDRITWSRWDAGVAGVARDGTVADAQVRLLFHCDHAVVDYCGAVVLRLVDECLAAKDRVHVTLLSAKSWAKQDRRTMTRLRRKWKDRFRTTQAGSLTEQMTAFHDHDWVIVPAVRAAFGITAVRAMACGAPVLAHDVEPFSELVTPEHNGLLVPCEVSQFGTRAPVAQVDVGKWLACLNRVVADNTLLLRMQCKVWDLSKHRSAFEKFWKAQLGLI